MSDPVMFSVEEPQEARFFSIHLVNALVITLGSFSGGQTMSYFPPVRKGMMQDLELSEFSANFFNLLALLSGIIGAPLSQRIIRAFGRRTTCFIIAVVSFISWILIAIAQRKTVWIAFVGRILLGMSSGSISGLCSMYIVEISPTNLRGTFGVLHQLIWNIGDVYSFLLGCFFTWRPLTYLSTIFVALWAIFIWFTPDSHVKEVSNGSDHTEKLFQHKYTGNVVRAFFMIGIRQLTGICYIVFNLTTIFEDSSVTISPDWCSVLVMVSQCISSGSSSFMIDKIGRKKVLEYSAVGQAISLFIMWDNYMWHIYSNLPVYALMFYIFSFGLGYGPVPFIIISEMFPDTVRSKAQLICSSLDSVFASIAVGSFPYLAKVIGYGWVFFIFAIVGIIAFIFPLYYIIETKGVELVKQEDANDQETPKEL